MHSRSLARELALLVLGQSSETDAALAEQPAMDGLLQKALDSLMILWRETLDGSAADLERAQQSLLDSELNQEVSVPTATGTSHLRSSISAAEQVLPNTVLGSLESSAIWTSEKAGHSLLRSRTMRMYSSLFTLAHAALLKS